MIVIDSSVWIGQLRGRDSPAVRKLQDIGDPSAILVGDLVLLEVLQGARDEAHAGRIERNLRRSAIRPMLSEAVALAAASHVRALRRAGITVRRTVDMIIGTFCMEHGHALLHEDKDFEPMALHLGLVTL